MKCEICGKVCKNALGLNAHITKIHKITSKDYFVKYLNDGIIPLCVCGNEVKFINLSKGFREYCSIKCLGRSTEVKEKRKQTCRERFGEENQFQNEEVKRKTKETIKLKFGVENVSQSEEVKQKKKKTCFKNNNVENPAQSKEVKEKMKQTCLKNHGAEYFLQTEEGKEKYKQTCQVRFGVNNPMQNEEVKSKNIQITREKFFENLFTTDYLKGRVTPLFTLEEFTGVGYYKKYSWKCNLCGSEFEDHLYSHIPRCLKCFPPLFSGTSLLEKDILLEIRDYLVKKFNKQFKIIENDREVLNGLEIDILIPELNLSIEVNGDYWHGFEEVEERDKEKSNLLIEKGYKHFVIREFEWDQIKDYTIEKLNKLLEIDFETYQENISYFTGFYYGV
jgi:hypothetical protein